MEKGAVISITVHPFLCFVLSFGEFCTRILYHCSRKELRIVVILLSKTDFLPQVSGIQIIRVISTQELAIDQLTLDGPYLEMAL